MEIKNKTMLALVLALSLTHVSMAQFKATAPVKVVSIAEQMYAAGKITREVLEATNAAKLLIEKGLASGGTKFVLYYGDRALLEVVNIFNNKTIATGITNPGLAPTQFIGLIKTLAPQATEQELLNASLAITDLVTPVVRAGTQGNGILTPVQFASEVDIFGRGYINIMTFKAAPQSRDIELGLSQTEKIMQDLYAVISGRTESQNSALITAGSGFRIKQVAIEAGSVGTKGL